MATGSVWTRSPTAREWGWTSPPMVTVWVWTVLAGAKSWSGVVRGMNYAAWGWAERQKWQLEKPARRTSLAGAPIGRAQTRPGRAH